MVQEGRLTAAMRDRVARVSVETNDRLCAVLVKLGLLSDSDLAVQLPLRLTTDAIEVACWDALDEFSAHALSFALGRSI